MAVNLVDLGRFDDALRFAEATLLLLPNDPVARLVWGFCNRYRGSAARVVQPRSVP
jgi:hypothetical protein